MQVHGLGSEADQAGDAKDKNRMQYQRRIKELAVIG